jgi:hypothetical protein
MLILAVAGETVMLVRSGMTESWAVAVIVPSVAVIVADPAPSACARPWLPGLLLMLATALELTLQVTVAVMFWVLPSE